MHGDSRQQCAGQACWLSQTVVCCRGSVYPCQAGNAMHACFSSLHSVHHHDALLLLPAGAGGGQPLPLALTVERHVDLA